jgi:hypothetical protein
MGLIDNEQPKPEWDARERVLSEALVRKALG